MTAGSGIVEMFIEAIKKAAEQDNKPYKTITVSMTGIKT